MSDLLETGVRDGFMQTGTPKMFSCKHGGLLVKLSSGFCVDEFQDLPIRSGQVLKAKNCNGCCILLVGLGGPTLIKNR